jgi:hypothetical protein
LVEDSEYRDGVLFPEEVDRIGKLMEKASSNAFADYGKLKRSLPDPIEKCGKLGGQAVAQSQSLIVIPDDGLFDVQPRLGPEE